MQGFGISEKGELIRMSGSLLPQSGRGKLLHAGIREK
jgi:hypothetical protein